MELVAFLAYHDARWLFGCRVKPLVLCLAIAFQTLVLLWGVWGFSLGSSPWWCIFRISLSVLLLLQLLGLVLDVQSERLFKELFVSFWSYVVLKLGLGYSELESDPTFTSTSVAFARTYEAVFFLITVIVVVGLLIKTGVLLLSLTKPRLHLRLYGYRDS